MFVWAKVIRFGAQFNYNLLGAVWVCVVCFVSKLCWALVSGWIRIIGFGLLTVGLFGIYLGIIGLKGQLSLRVSRLSLKWACRLNKGKT